MAWGKWRNIYLSEILQFLPTKAFQQLPSAPLPGSISQFVSQSETKKKADVTCVFIKYIQVKLNMFCTTAHDIRHKSHNSASDANISDLL
jgi:hypothetical protein